jgi:hypothetical protein
MIFDLVIVPLTVYLIEEKGIIRLIPGNIQTPE